MVFYGKKNPLQNFPLPSRHAPPPISDRVTLHLFCFSSNCYFSIHSFAGHWAGMESLSIRLCRRAFYLYFSLLICSWTSWYTEIQSPLYLELTVLLWGSPVLSAAWKTLSHLSLLLAHITLTRFNALVFLWGGIVWFLFMENKFKFYSVSLGWFPGIENWKSPSFNQLPPWLFLSHVKG